jgi:hypothetical protein
MKESGTMLKRIVFLGTLSLLSVTMLLSGQRAADPAEAQASIGQLTFSTGMNERFEPTGNVGIEFPGGNNGVYVTFAYSDLPSGSGLSRIVRVNDQDYNWDDQNGSLNCCSQGGSGRYGFPIVRPSSSEIGDLPGGGYEVIVYLNGAEATRSGFGISGGGGLDNGGEDGDDGDDGDNGDGGDND